MKMLNEMQKHRLATGLIGKAQRDRTFYIPNLKGVTLVVRAGEKKIKLKIADYEGVNWQRQAGPFAPYLRKGVYDVKASLLTPEVWALMERVWLFEKENDDLIPIVINTKDREDSYVDAERFARLFMFCMKTSTQNKLIDRLTTLSHPQFYYYLSAWTGNRGRIEDFDVAQWKGILQNGMSPDHLGKGFLPMKLNIKDHIDTAVFVANREENEVWTLGGAKKALSRLKLSYSINGADIGNYRCFVITEMPQALVPMHETGGIYAPPAVFRKYGASRVTGGKSLVKGVLTPQPVEMHEDFYHTLVMSKNAFKGELQGLELYCGHLTTRKVMGHDCVGYEVVLPLTITNLIVAYGFSVSDKFKNPELLATVLDNPAYGEFANQLYNSLSDADQSEAEEDMENNSVYVYIVNCISRDSDFNPCEWLMGALHIGLIVQSDNSAQLKAFDILNVYRSYGYDVASSFVNAALTHSRRTYNELNAYLTGQLELHEIPEDVIHNVANTMFGQGKGITSKLDPEDIKKRISGKFALDKYQRYVDAYLTGSPHGFNGLLGDQAKCITINGLRFYIPSGRIMKMFVYDSKDILGNNTGVYYMNGPAYLANELFNLIGLYRNVNNIPKAHLQMFYIWYTSKLQESMFGKYGENLDVDGFANKMICPNYWSSDTVYGFDINYRKWNGKSVVFSKMPVLFNKAMHGVMYSNQFDGRFGELDLSMMFALQSCIFVPNSILLAHQNDTDGDLGRIMFIKDHGLPIFDGSQLPEYMHDWQDEYESGERDINMKPKSFEPSPWDSMDKAMREALLAKRTIGRATNLANIINTIGLEKYGQEFAPTGDALYMMLQEIIRDVKHKGDGPSILTYLSETSFPQIFGAHKTDWNTGDVEDMSYEALSYLSGLMHQRVKGDYKHHQLLMGIREDYPMEVVNGQFMTGNFKLETLTWELMYLSMYIRTINKKVADNVRKPNYVSYLDDINSYDHQLFDKYLTEEGFAIVCANLLFHGGLEKPAKQGLIELWNRVLVQTGRVSS